MPHIFLGFYMNCSVIGNGPLGLSVAVQLVDGGCNVTYIDLSDKKVVINSYGKDGIVPVVDGDSYPVKMSITDGFDSIADCQLLVMGTTCSCYPQLFESIKGMIRDDIHLLFMPACYGAILLKHQLSELGIKPTISEATSYPYVCALSGKGLVVQSKKQTLGLAVCPNEKVEEETAFYNRYFKIFSPVKNFLFTSLDNMNLTLHPLPVLLNLDSTDPVRNGFRHYIDGFTPGVGRLSEMVDEERLAIGRAFGLSLTSSLQQLKNYYGESEAEDIRTYVTNPTGPYPKVGGFGPMSRYVDEDVPGLLVPASELAQSAGISVPAIDLSIELASLINGKDYRELGFNLAKLGLAGKSIEDIIEVVEN